MPNYASEPLTIEIKGWDTVRANIRNLYIKAPEAFGQSLREEMDTAMQISQIECPFDPENPHRDGTPHMRDTGKVEGPIFYDDAVSVNLSYDVPYAAIQHENPEYSHTFPEKWKFLEDPVNSRVPNIAPRLIERVDEILRGY